MTHVSVAAAIYVVGAVLGFDYLDNGGKMDDRAPGSISLEQRVMIGQLLDDLDRTDRLCAAIANVLTDGTTDDIGDRIEVAYDALMRCKTRTMERSRQDRLDVLDNLFASLKDALARTYPADVLPCAIDTPEMTALVTRLERTSIELRGLIDAEITAKMRGQPHGWYPAVRN